jgi:hypothetical protein
MYNFKAELVNSFLQLGKTIGAGLATIGLAGAGVGVGIVFGALVLALAETPPKKALIQVCYAWICTYGSCWSPSFDDGIFDPIQLMEESDVFVTVILACAFVWLWWYMDS